MCSQCFRLGHIRSQCKSTIRCLNCGETHNTDECKNTSTGILCINCKANGHKANSKNCPLFLEKSKKKRDSVMADSYAVVTKNRFNLLENTDEYEAEFPSIQPPTGNNISRHNKKVHRSSPYQRPVGRQQKTAHSSPWFEEGTHPWNTTVNNTVILMSVTNLAIIVNPTKLDLGNPQPSFQWKR